MHKDKLILVPFSKPCHNFTIGGGGGGRGVAVFIFNQFLNPFHHAAALAFVLTKQRSTTITVLEEENEKNR